MNFTTRSTPWGAIFFQGRRSRISNYLRAQFMEEENEEVSGTIQRNQIHIPGHYWWALASAAQFGWAIKSTRKGIIGDSRMMPLKAFGVASLFVGAFASAATSGLKASGIHKVEDFMEVGASIRTALKVRPRARDQ